MATRLFGMNSGLKAPAFNVVSLLFGTDLVLSSVSKRLDRVTLLDRTSCWLRGAASLVAVYGSLQNLRDNGIFWAEDRRSVLIEKEAGSA